MKQYTKTRKKTTSAILLLAAACILLSGCAVQIPLMEKKSEESEFTMETLGLVPDFSYERKIEKPTAQIDRLGYLPDSSKTVFFRGEELPDRFQVIAKDTGECVYEGDIRIGAKAADGLLTGYGNFTEYREEGSYYIRADKIGCSYYFDIKKDVYLETAKKYGALIEETQTRETADLCEAVSYLLAAYEMYPNLALTIWNSGSKETEAGQTDAGAFFRMLRRKTDLLLSVQDEKTGVIYKTTETAPASKTAQETKREGSEEATAIFAGTMAKYGYLYQEYDWEYANICLKAAAKAWRYLNGAEYKNTFNDNMAAGKIYAAAELYRASNETLYHNYILQNREWFADKKDTLYLLMGKLTYLSTKRKVDHELCGQMINGLMRETETIVSAEKEELFLIEERGTDKAMWDMTVVTLTNYAIMNHEYVTVVENYLHYLFGRNADGTQLAENLESKEVAKMLLLLSVVEEERKIVEEAEEIK